MGQMLVGRAALGEEVLRAAAAALTGGWRAVAVAVLAVVKRLGGGGAVLGRTEAHGVGLTVIPKGKGGGCTTPFNRRGPLRCDGPITPPRPPL